MPESPTANASSQELSTGFDPVALVAAAALPGLGHFVAGDRRRGVLVGAGILGLFASGVLIGGISVVDRKENDWWFIGQAMVGPMTFAIDHFHQTQLKEKASNGSTLTPDPVVSKYKRAIGKPLDIGILFTAIAGMLNVIAVIDAGFPTRRRPTII